jgi:hypothetical protein
MSVYSLIQLKRSGIQDLPAEMDPNHEGLGYGQNIPMMYKRLDALAAKAGVRPITSYFYDSELLSEEDRAEFGMPPVDQKWAPVTEGLRTVSALVSGLTAEGATAGELWDLEACEMILHSALESGEAFRFYVG